MGLKPHHLIWLVLLLARESDPHLEHFCEFLLDGRSEGGSWRLGRMNFGDKLLKNRLLYIGFNQTYGCFSVGTETGFSIWNCNPLKLRFTREFDQGIGIVEMLFRCNILALVGGGKSPKWPPNVLVIWDDYRNRPLAEINFRNDIKAVRMRRDKIVVALEKKVYVYNFSDLKLVDELVSYYNPKGLLALAPETSKMVLAFPAPQVGHVFVKVYHGDTNQQELRPIKAHESEISQLALTRDGSRLATTSVQGTIIRIWDTATKTNVSEIRRGRSQAIINWLSFSQDSSKLCLTSDKGTTHIFSITNLNGSPVPKPEPEQATGWGGLLRSVSNVSVESLGGGVIWNWSHAQFHINEPLSIGAFAKRDDNDEQCPETDVIVVAADGSFYRYTFNATDGGEAKEVERILFLAEPEE